MVKSLKKLLLLLVSTFLIVSGIGLLKRDRSHSSTSNSPPLGSFDVWPQDPGYFYVFDIEEFQGKLYAFLSPPSSQEKPSPPQALIKALNAEKTAFEKAALLELPEPGTQVRNTFNGSDQRFFIVTSRSQGGDIYLTSDMKNFEKVYSSDEFGIRSIIKFKGWYLAGTDGDGLLLGSRDGKGWGYLCETCQIQQLNEMVVFKDKLYFVSNAGVFVTNGDLKEIRRVFTPPPPGNKQTYAVHTTPEVMYVGTGWDETEENYGRGNIFVTSDGEGFDHITTTPETPMVYFINKASPEPGDLLWGGYQSEGIYRLNAATGEYQEVLHLPGKSLYATKEFEEDIYIGSYGNPPVIIKYQME